MVSWTVTDLDTNFEECKVILIATGKLRLLKYKDLDRKLKSTKRIYVCYQNAP